MTPIAVAPAFPLLQEASLHRGTVQRSAVAQPQGTLTEAHIMVRFAFGILTPLMFLTSVTMYLADFRLVAVAFAAAGCVSHFVGHRINSDD